MRTSPVTRHRKQGCRKPECLLRHESKLVVTVCRHRQSPNCLRQRCVQERKIPYTLEVM